MGRSNHRRAQRQSRTRGGTFESLCSRISEEKVIPIVGTALFYDQIFDPDRDGLLRPCEDPNEAAKLAGLTLEEQLASWWAEELEFPLAHEVHQLAQVALYNRAVVSNDLDAKRGFLGWLKDILLELAESDPEVDSALIDEQGNELNRSSFADIAVELGYPRPMADEPDMLAQLAKLNLPIYVTTSYFDFLERAIMANGRTPRTQVCFWSGEPMNVEDEHRTDHSFVPTAETPLVYHLFGLEAYPESLVLTEDDYLEFLAKIVRDGSNQQNPSLPLYLLQALTQSSLVLLGYQLHDWDFRILIRSLINTAPESVRNVNKLNVAIQLTPAHEDAFEEELKDYLEGYFGKQLQFEIEYGTMSQFINQMWEAWQQWR